MIKKEVQLSILVEKNGKGEPLPGAKTDGEDEEEDEERNKEKNEEEQILEQLRYPAIGKLNQMGIRYRPSLRYKIHSREANILKNPDLELVLA